MKTKKLLKVVIPLFFVFFIGSCQTGPPVTAYHQVSEDTAPEERVTVLIKGTLDITKIDFTSMRVKGNKSSYANTVLYLSPGFHDVYLSYRSRHRYANWPLVASMFFTPDLRYEIKTVNVGKKVKLDIKTYPVKKD